jgi:hypothetical protein
MSALLALEIMVSGFDVAIERVEEGFYCPICIRIRFSGSF